MTEVGRCQERANQLAAELRGRGVNAVVANGWYQPDTAPSSWHPAWQRLAERYASVLGNGFIHYWVESEDRILDPSAAQFGGPELQEAALDDPRYRRPRSS